MTKLHQIYSSPSAPRGDVVFVHGLGGDPYATWQKDSTPTWFAWLPQQRPDLNFWSLEYEIHPTAWTGTAMPLSDRAMNVLAALDAAGIGARPLCFLTHSMGGLLVKQLLRHAVDLAKEYSHIARSTRGVVFFSTPHAGSGVATLLTYIALFLRTTIAMEELQAHEPRLRELNLWYRSNADGLDIASKVFYETKETKGVLVVNATSADPGLTGVSPIPVDTDHLQVCHPDSPEDFRYRQVVRFLDSRLVAPVAEDLPDWGRQVQELRRGLLVARSGRDLRQLLYQVEEAVAAGASKPELLVLRDEIQLALRYEELNMSERTRRVACSVERPVSMPPSRKWSLARLLVTSGAVLFVIYFLWKLVQWILGL
jgi:hypothetical protein